MPARARRILFKTPSSQLCQRDEFSRDFARLTGDAARYLVDRSARLVGIDHLSVGDHDAQVTLLEAGVVVLEGLDLRAVEPGASELICLTLKIIESDGAPARAILVSE